MGRNELAVYRRELARRRDLGRSDSWLGWGFLLPASSHRRDNGLRSPRRRPVATEDDLAARRRHRIGRHPRNRDDRYHLVAWPHHDLAMDPGVFAYYFSGVGLSASGRL